MTPLASEEYGSPVLMVPDYQWEDMRHYIRDCADHMGLRDWTANYYKVKPDDLGGTDCSAAIEVSPRRRHFTIWLPLDWFHKAGGSEDERKEARASVAHELLHVVTRRLRNIPESLHTNLGDHVYGTWWSIYEDELEIMVDDLAEICAEALPMPNMPQTDPTKKTSKIAKTKKSSR